MLMGAPIKLIGNYNGDISYLNAYGRPGKAGIVTTGHGSILEANDEAAKLFNVISAKAMKNVLIVSYAHRSSVQNFKSYLHSAKNVDSFSTDLLVLRPRGGVPFKAAVSAKVIARGQQIVLLYWEVSVATISGLKIA